MLSGMHRRFFLLLSSVALLSACSSETKDEQGNEAFAPQCEETRRTVGLDDETPFGITPREAFERAKGDYTAELTWKGGAKTGLTLAFTTEVTEVVFVDREPKYGSGERPAIALECNDDLETSVDITFATEDGAFDETFRGVRLRWEKGPDGAVLRGYHPIELESLAGSYEPNELDPSEYDRIVQPSLRFEIDGEGAFSGDFGYVAEKHHGEGPEGSVSAKQVEAASW